MSTGISRADTLIKARWLLTMEPAERVLEHQALVIRDGVIADILPSAEADARWQADKVYDLGDHALLPGFVNAHTHLAMNLFRGIANDLPLMSWLQDHIWPTEGQWVSDEFVFEGTRFAIAELIRSGSTTFGDMYFFPDAVARAAHESGIRAVIFSPIMDFPTPMGQGPDDYLRIALQCHDKWKHENLIDIGFGPHAPYTVSDEPLNRMLVLARELDLPIMMHIHETAGEVAGALESTGKRPLQRLHELGLLGPRLLAVHMTQLTDDEIRLVAETGTSVAHCPESNLKLASGFCPIHGLHCAGANVAIGTDGAASNNDIDMLGELHTAAILAKAVANEAAAIPAPLALQMATLNGAKALGLDKKIGSLAIGKQADVIAINLAEIETQPMFDPIAHIVYSASRQQITHSFVAGRCLMEQRQLTTLNEARVLRDARHWGQRIQGEQP